MAFGSGQITADELREKAKQNAADWHLTGDEKKKDKLHRQNIEINRMLDGLTGSTSTFDTASGIWTVTGGTDDAANLKQPQELNRLIDEYKTLNSGAQNSAGQQALEQQRQAQEAAVQKAVNALEAQKTDTDAQYADLFRQLYIDKMRNRKNLDQQLSAMGVTGGAAETTRLGYDTAYEDALRQGEQGRISAVGSLDQAIADARLTGDIESANAAAAAAREQMDAYADALQFLINRQDKLDAQQEAYAREDAQRAAVYAAQLAKEQREAEEAAERSAKPTLTVAQVNAAIKAGVLTDAVLAAYEYYYGEAYRQ
ncbi:MAG: hypothetical protein IKN81_04145 [Oscillospiraceae bacterium]|nr:hypothetical protein [Oscillospiraceae bacterium]